MKWSIDYMRAHTWSSMGGHKICQKHFYPKAKDATVESFNCGMFVLL